MRSAKFRLMLKPLSNVVVLDLTRVLSGPFCTQQLVDLGAKVIKVENPTGGDDTRRFGPPFINGVSTYFLSINRGKRSLAIDLKHEKGRKIVTELVSRSDVLIENFRPGTASRLGFDQAKLREVNPRLITCSISGYGAFGHNDFSSRAGYDAVIQAASGIMALTGEPEGEPTKVGVAVSDMVAGLYAAQGILAALFNREKSGQGVHIDISMQDGMLSLLTYQAGMYFATGQHPPRMGNAHPSICPYETIEVQDGLLALAVGNDAQFVKLAELLGCPNIAQDPRFESNRCRVQNREALLEIIEPLFKGKSMNEWDTLLTKAKIPGGPVLSVPQALEHPQVQARASILTHQHPTAGQIRTVGTPVRFGEEEQEDISAPPLLGQHTSEILEEIGYSEEDLSHLLNEGVVAIEKA